MDHSGLLRYADNTSPSSNGNSLAHLDSQAPPTFQELKILFKSQSIPDHDRWCSPFESAVTGSGINEVSQILVPLLQHLPPETFAIATKILADGSRYVPWRLPFGQEHVLGFYLDLIAKDESEQEWTSDALRLIGNTCADLDVNRERVLAKLNLPLLLKRLKDNKTSDLAIGVLCNLSFDYEPAQEALRNCQLFPIIMSMLERSCFDLRLLTQVCRLLDFAAEDFDPKLCPETSVAGICDTILSHNLEVEDQVSLGNAIVAILKHEHFQQLSIMHDHIMAILDLYVFTYTQDPKAVESSGLLAPNLVHRPTLDAEDETQLSALRSALAAALWDISSLTEFSERYPPTSSLVETIVSWISIPEPQMQLCACSILRNISCSDRTSIQMVHDLHVQKPVSYILKDATNLQILEEALRLLKNLALPAQNKPAISSTLSLDIITSLWSKFKSPTIQYAAISLTRHLLRGCCSNVRQFLTSETNARERLNNTSVSRLVALYESVDDPAIRTEVVRTVVEVFRTLRAETSAPKTSLLETGAYLTALWRANIAKPVVAMILESKNASLMTEGWFGLSLMASSKEGSDAVYEALCGQNSLAVFRATLSSQESQSRDRDNARILADKLVKYSADNPARLAILKPMLSMYESSLESKETATNTADLEEL